jgi:hypothetical protein
MINLDIQQLNNIDLADLSNLIISEEHKNYFLEKAGIEHYRLLSYFSTLFSNTTLLDIGTYKGNSALALSYNNLNKVYTFDLENYVELYKHPSNIEFYIDNILDVKYRELILSSPFILVDTFHDGILESNFHNYLSMIRYQGYLMLDDIKLNSDMINYWDSIKEEKYDISMFGHWSGTGIVIFN